MPFLENNLIMPIKNKPQNNRLEDSKIFMSNIYLFYFILTTCFSQWTIIRPSLQNSEQCAPQCKMVLRCTFFKICVNMQVLEQVFEIAAHIRPRVVTLHNLKL